VNDDNAEPSTLEKFESLLDKLVRVPKEKVDEAIRDLKEQRDRDREEPGAEAES